MRKIIILFILLVSLSSCSFMRGADNTFSINTNGVNETIDLTEEEMKTLEDKWLPYSLNVSGATRYDANNQKYIMNTVALTETRHTDCSKVILLSMKDIAQPNKIGSNGKPMPPSLVDEEWLVDACGKEYKYRAVIFKTVRNLYIIKLKSNEKL